MSHLQGTHPAIIGSRADHLDLALAACDDLMKASASNREANCILRLELTAITHVLQARGSLGELRGEDRDLACKLGSFASDTDALEMSFPGAARAQAGDVALVGGCIPVGDLRSSLATLLAALGSRYSLDPEDGAEEDELPASRSGGGEVQIWALGPEVG
jgi:hypothetical protein